MAIIEKIRTAARKRRAYIRTRDEIARLSRSEALDLGIYPEDAARIAHQAVYGK